MATEIIQSLFGVTPQNLQQAQQDRIDAQALAYANLDPFQQANFAVGRGANMLAGAVGGALGAQDPELQRITLRQQIAAQLNPNDLSSFDRGIEMMRQAGDGQGALMLSIEADKFKQQALLRSDEALVRQDAAAKRAREAQALAQQQAAEKVALGAYSPGEAQFYGKSTNATLVDDQGFVMPGASVTSPSYDVKKVTPQLLALGAAGQAQLLGISKVNEEIAKADKLAAEAISVQQKAVFAPAAEKAEAEKKIADAETARVGALFAERLQLAGFNKTNWDIKNLQSQISDRAQKLKLDTQITTATVAEKLSNINAKLTDLPADTRKLINESATLAATSKQSANQMNDLAGRIETLGGYGSLSRLGEFAKSTFGAEGYETSLRQEYTRIRNSAAIKALPPGAATDKDINLALSGFPKDTSDSKLVASFLRGMAKLQDIDASVSNAKTDWLAQNNGTLTRASKTFVAGDYTARPGESFNDFASRVAQGVNAQYSGATAEGQRQALVGQIPTNSPAPAAAKNVMKEADAILRKGQ